MRLFLSQLRRERVIVPIWIAGIALVAAAAAGAVISQFGTDAERTAIVSIAVVNPAFLFMRGAPDGVSAGALTFFQVFSFTAVAAALMSMFLVTRHTRAPEEDGRAELELSTAIHRSDPLRATLALAAGAAAVLSAAVAGALAAAGLPSAGSALFGAAVGTIALFFAGLTALVAQLAPTGRATNAVVGASIAAAFVVRGIGDALGLPDTTALRVIPHPLSLLSPIGWGEATRPFTEPAAWMLVAPLGAGFALAVGAVLLRERRDLGASIAREASGQARMRYPSGVLGLAWRQSRLAIVSWSLGSAALGVLGAALSPLVASVVGQSDSLVELVRRLLPGTETDIASVFMAGLIGIAGLLAACAGVQVVMRLRSDESAGRSELLLSLPLTRARLVVIQSLIATAAVLLVTGIVGVAAWLAIATMQPTADAAIAASGLGHAPAASAFIAVAALLVAFAPRAAVPLTWVALALSIGIGQFGELLALPDWVRWLSPFSHAAAAPVERVNLGEALLLTAAAIGGTGMAALAARRRDLVAG